jgi:RNA polymerase sigma-70 factor (ECF subfamily)
MPTLSLEGVEEGNAKVGGASGQDFVARLRARDLDAIAEAYDAHHAALCSFAKRLLGDDHAAEDLVQDVFLVLPDVAHRFAPPASLRSFLLGIAANRAKHHVRSRSRLRRFFERFEYEPNAEVETPERLTERHYLATLLARAIDTLPLDHRTTFVLKEIEGYSAKEAGEILQIPEATVRTRLFHSRARLRAFLDGGAR